MNASQNQTSGEFPKSKGSEGGPKGGELAKLAGQLCTNPNFWIFCSERFTGNEMVTSTDEAADLVRYLCGVSTRAKLDSNEQAAKRFHDLFRKPYLVWLETSRLA